MLVQTASINVDCRKAEWLECFISCIIGCHTPARVVKEDEGSRSEPHGTPKHNSELCSRIAHYSTARNRHFWRDTTDRAHRTVAVAVVWRRVGGCDSTKAYYSDYSTAFILNESFRKIWNPSNDRLFTAYSCTPKILID